MVAMKLALAAALLVSLSSVAKADEWTRSDTALQLAGGALMVADYLQTRQITRAPIMPDHYESNPILRTGKGGLGLSPELYFLSAAGTHTMVALVLPKPWRRVAQVGLIAFQSWVVGSNWSAGYSFGF
jgi:hypothetical protein